MIKAEFYLHNEVLVGFSVKGHAGYANYGYDVVCAAVTSAIELTANAITEILKVKASVVVLEDEVKLTLPNDKSLHATDFVKALRLHLELLSQDYKENIQLTDIEV